MYRCLLSHLSPRNSSVELRGFFAREENKMEWSPIIYTRTQQIALTDVDNCVIVLHTEAIENRGESDGKEEN